VRPSLIVNTEEYNDLFLLDAFFRKTLFSVKYLKNSQFGYQSGKTKNGIISSRLSRDNADEKL
jgi:hypothetical protein